MGEVKVEEGEVILMKENLREMKRVKVREGGIRES